MRWTAFTLAPAVIANEAAVCFSSCGVNPARATDRTARSNTSRRKLPFLSTAPSLLVNSRSSADFAVHGDGELLPQEAGHRHGPRLVRLGSAEDKHPVDLSDRLHDPNPSSQRIDVSDRQGSRLAWVSNPRRNSRRGQSFSSIGSTQSGQSADWTASAWSTPCLSALEWTFTRRSRPAPCGSPRNARCGCARRSRRPQRALQR
jgi:hypothetical protein